MADASGWIWAALVAALTSPAIACSSTSSEEPDTDGTPSHPDAGAAAGGDPPAPDAGGCAPSSDTCFDPATGLTWQNPSADQPLTWSAAKAYCEHLPLAGGGWRLPKVQELRSLIRGCTNTELGGPCRATDPECAHRACMQGCDQCPTVIVNGVKECLWAPWLLGSCERAHWSSTAYADSIDPGAWYVDFGHGAFVHGWLQSQPLLARCVR
jgi:hypothetical protein